MRFSSSDLFQQRSTVQDMSFRCHSTSSSNALGFSTILFQMMAVTYLCSKLRPRQDVNLNIFIFYVYLVILAQEQSSTLLLAFQASNCVGKFQTYDCLGLAGTPYFPYSEIPPTNRFGKIFRNLEWSSTDNFSNYWKNIRKSRPL